MISTISTGIGAGFFWLYTNIYEIFHNNLLWQEGQSIITILAVFAVIFYLLYKPGVYLIVFLLCFSCFFFRNPDRVCREAEHDSSVLVSPCDGTVLDIEQQGLHDTGGIGETGGYKISIFLNVFDVHVNWVPCAGVIKNSIYHPGKFYCAFLPKASELNERNELVIEREDGTCVRIVQITGTIARTIVCWVKEQQKVCVGQKFGMMKFGSRIDLFLPAHVQLEVVQGQYVRGGETVIGTFLGKSFS